MWFNGATFIVEYKVAGGDPNKVDMASARPVMRIDFPVRNHHGGKIAFGPDGYLYVGVGDGGWEGDVLDAGPDLSTWMGKMLRIDVNVKKGYAIPESNPYATASIPKLMVLFGVSELEFSKIKQRSKPEIWAYGIRNPWTFSFDRKTGDLYIADIGQNIWEEINVQPASSKGGEDYGWNKDVRRPPVPDREGEVGQEVDAVGRPPRRRVQPRDGRHLHHRRRRVSAAASSRRSTACTSSGDWGTGRLWGLKRNDGGKWQLQQLLHTKLHFTSGGEDEQGNLVHDGRREPVRHVRESL
jgi:hypothetical protein